MAEAKNGSTRGPYIVNLGDVPMKDTKKGTRFAARAGRIGSSIAMKALGAQYMVVPPGKAAYPCHAHHVNEEFYVILEGRGTYRAGEDSWPVGSGDVVAAPAGPIETAHQLTNTSDEDLRYLVVSTRLDPDLVEYPDSGKFAVSSGIPEGQGMTAARFGFIGRKGETLDYWDGEDTGESDGPER